MRGSYNTPRTPSPIKDSTPRSGPRLSHADADEREEQLKKSAERFKKGEK